MIRSLRCAVIVVSYNSARHLRPCLSSLEAQRDVETQIYVVDNASSDGSSELVRREFPRVHLLESRRYIQCQQQKRLCRVSVLSRARQLIPR